mmetsp:Transcript_47146/g.151125  ORF Transcript_47146/g.151125 Transcript_47146/m.151125 type:complete len:222 (+) Transcript_47146:546-1211(+)
MTPPPRGGLRRLTRRTNSCSITSARTYPPAPCGSSTSSSSRAPAPSSCTRARARREARSLSVTCTCAGYTSGRSWCHPTAWTPCGGSTSRSRTGWTANSPARCCRSGSPSTTRRERATASASASMRGSRSPSSLHRPAGCLCSCSKLPSGGPFSIMSGPTLSAWKILGSWAGCGTRTTSASAASTTTRRCGWSMPRGISRLTAPTPLSACSRERARRCPPA